MCAYTHPHESRMNFLFKWIWDEIQWYRSIFETLGLISPVLNKNKNKRNVSACNGCERTTSGVGSSFRLYLRFPGIGLRCLVCVPSALAAELLGPPVHFSVWTGVIIQYH